MMVGGDSDRCCASVTEGIQAAENEVTSENSPASLSKEVPPLLPKKRTFMPEDGDENVAEPCESLSTRLEEYRATLETVERTCKRLKSEIDRVATKITPKGHHHDNKLEAEAVSMGVDGVGAAESLFVVTSRIQEQVEKIGSRLCSENEKLLYVGRSSECYNEANNRLAGSADWKESMGESSDEDEEDGDHGVSNKSSLHCSQQLHLLAGSGAMYSTSLPPRCPGSNPSAAIAIGDEISSPSPSPFTLGHHHYHNHSRPKSLPPGSYLPFPSITPSSREDSFNWSSSERHEPLDLSVTGRNFASPNGDLLHINNNNNNHSNGESLCGSIQRPDSPDGGGGLRRPSDDTLERFMKVDPSQNVKWRELAERFGKELAPNICGICGKTLSCKSALTMHYRVHTEERPFVCSICDKRFSTKGNLKTHLGQHGDTIDAVRSTSVFMTTSTPMMTSGDALMQCGEDGGPPIPFYLEAASLQELDSYSKEDSVTEPPPTLDQQPQQQVFYTGDNKIDENNTDLETDVHIVATESAGSESGIAMSGLQIVEAEAEVENMTTTEESVKLESTADSGIILATSSQSEIGSPDTNTSASSRRKEYNCETCSKAFPTRSALQIHTRSHTGEKPFHCADCQKPFSTQGNMKTHREKHCPCRRNASQHQHQQQQASQQSGMDCLQVGVPPPPPPPPASWQHHHLAAFSPFWHQVVRPSLPLIGPANFRSLLSSFPPPPPGPEMKGGPMSLSPWLTLPSPGQLVHTMDLTPSSSKIAEIRGGETNSESLGN